VGGFHREFLRVAQDRSCVRPIGPQKGRL
jgi:hypothetical protein